MANIKVPNLCGANETLNALQLSGETMFNSLKDDIAAGVDVSTLISTAETTADASLAKLRELIPELPELPNTNFQAEVTGLLTNLQAGTPQYLQKLASITDDFGDELTALNLSLDDLITKSLTAIEGGGDLCSICPNLEKTPLGDVIQKAPESVLTGLEAAKEDAAKFVPNEIQNATKEDVEAGVKEMTTTLTGFLEAVTGFAVNGTVVNDTPLKSGEEKGAFKATKEDQKTKVVFGGREISVINPANQNGKNVATDGAGFTTCKTRAQERFKDGDVTQSGDTWTIKLSEQCLDIAMLTGNSLVTRRSGSLYQSTPTTEEIQMFVEIAKKGEHIDYSTSHHTATSAYYEIDGQTVTITGRGQNFFPHTSTHKTYFDENKKDVEFTVAYDYFDNYDPR